MTWRATPGRPECTDERKKRYREEGQAEKRKMAANDGARKQSKRGD
jgi:hypothetical protein